MWILNGNCSRIYGNEEGWTGSDGTNYGGDWDKSTFPGFQQVVLTPQPVDPAIIVTGNSVQMINGIPTQVWVTAAAPVIPIDPNTIITEFTSAAQKVLDTAAQGKGYDSILSAVTYISSTNATFRAEAQAFIAWRDAVWASAYNTLAAVQAGTQTQPSISDFIANLPKLN